MNEWILQEVVGTIYDLNHREVGSGYLLGMSADGSFFLTSENQGTIRDSRAGELMGGFATSHSPVGPDIVDGIAFHDTHGAEKGIVVLLPGPG